MVELNTNEKFQYLHQFNNKDTETHEIQKAIEQEYDQIEKKILGEDADKLNSTSEIPLGRDFESDGENQYIRTEVYKDGGVWHLFKNEISDEKTHIKATEGLHREVKAFASEKLDELGLYGMEDDDKAFELDESLRNASPQEKAEIELNNMQYSRTERFRDGSVKHLFMDETKTMFTSIHATPDFKDSLDPELRDFKQAEIQQEHPIFEQLDEALRIAPEPMYEITLHENDGDAKTLEIEESIQNASPEQRAEIDGLDEEGYYKRKVEYLKTEVFTDGSVRHSFLDESKIKVTSIHATPDFIELLEEKDGRHNTWMALRENKENERDARSPDHLEIIKANNAELEELEKEFGAKNETPKESVKEENTIDAVVIDPPKSTEKTINPDIDKRFRIEEKGSTLIYRYTNDNTRIAFKETGSKLTTTENSPALIKNMLQVAEDNGWTSIKLKGTDEFKRQGWLEASARGMEVKGYEPTEQDLRHLEEQLAKQGNTIEAEGKNQSPVNKEQEGQTQTNPSDVKTARATELKEAMSTMDEQEAVKKYPELEAVYKTEPAAAAFYRKQGGLNVEQESEFVKRVTDKAIEDIASGKSIPTFKSAEPAPTQTTAQAQPASTPEVKASRKEIDFD